MISNPSFGDHETISATKIVRNFSAAVDRVRYTGKSLYITKGSKTIAELTPPPKSGFPTQCLKELFDALPSLGSDATTFAKDIKSLNHNAPIPDDPWES
jgi:antitoxin (DNA-binding transcriptional repressor) of toxin-antitoxin stability system